MGRPSRAVVNCSADANDSAEDEVLEELSDLVRRRLYWLPASPVLSTILVPTPAPLPLASVGEEVRSVSCAFGGSAERGVPAVTSTSTSSSFAHAQSRNLTASCTILLGTFRSTMNRGMPP